MLASGVAGPTAAEMESVTDAWAPGAPNAGVAAPAAEADIACNSTPVSVESAAPFAANVPDGEAARPVEANAGAGAVLDAALSTLDAPRAGLAAARTAALLINGVDPAWAAALVLFNDPWACAAAVVIASVPDAGLGAEVILIAPELFRSPAASELAAAACKSIAVCGLNAPTIFEGLEAAVDGAVSSPTVAWAATGCGVAPEDPAGAVADFDPALIGASMAAFAGVADGSAGGNPAPGPPAATGTSIGNPAAAPAVVPAAADGGGKGDGEDLPAAGRLRPLGSALAAVCSVGLRLGFAPASLKALAKFCPWASLAEEFADAA